MLFKNLTKLQLILTLFFTVASPLAMGLISYERAIARTEKEFVQIRLEREQAFVKRDEMKIVHEKLERVAEDVAAIRGYLEHTPRPRR